MAKIVLIEPTELYNILNQETVYPCLSDQNFLLLLGKWSFKYCFLTLLGPPGFYYIYTIHLQQVQPW